MRRSKPPRNRSPGVPAKERTVVPDMIPFSVASRGKSWIRHCYMPGLRGTGSLLLSRRSTSRCGRLLNVAPRTPVSNCPLQEIGTGRGSETSCFSAGEQPLCNFRVAGDRKRADGLALQVVEGAAKRVMKSRSPAQPVPDSGTGGGAACQNIPQILKSACALRSGARAGR
jgi:hypothetical protein